MIEPLTDDELRALVKACQPPKGAEPKEALRHRRDEAIVRVMFETGAPSRRGRSRSELDDVDLMAGTITVRRGKGGKGRTVPIGPEPPWPSTATCGCAAATGSPPRNDLWLGDRGKRFSYDALHKTLGERAAAPASSASTPTSCGTPPPTAGSPRAAPRGGLMAVAGWTRPDMLMRYTKAQASATAAEEARRLNLGEL